MSYKIKVSLGHMRQYYFNVLGEQVVKFKGLEFGLDNCSYDEDAENELRNAIFDKINTGESLLGTMPLTGTSGIFVYHIANDDVIVGEWAWVPNDDK